MVERHLEMSQPTKNFPFSIRLQSFTIVEFLTDQPLLVTLPPGIGRNRENAKTLMDDFDAKPFQCRREGR